MSSALHYWIERARPERRMQRNSTGVGIVCAHCGIAYGDSQPGVACPRSSAATKAELTEHIEARARGSHD